MSGQIRNSLAEREKTNFEARTVPFFMIDKQLHPFHASIQIHPDFFLALFQRIMLQIRLGKEKYSISRLSSVPLRENSAEQLSICLQYEKCNLTKNKWQRE